MPRREKRTQTKKSTKSRFNVQVVPKTENQQIYIDSIKDNTITVCSGFAGTGKSLLAVGMALSLVHSAPGIYSRILVVRPAIEACDEKIGYLPGSANDKMRPFIEPLVDGLRHFISDQSQIATLLEPNIHTGAPILEIIPIAFMRGRNFHNCVVIFDEAQNATARQMKLFLTRIGQNCKAIIEGDVTQSDIDDDPSRNGLADCMRRLDGCADVGICYLEASDIQRSEILGEILKRYEDV